MEPTKEDIQKWQEIAKRRNAILPFQFQFLSKKEINIVCGKCNAPFTRPLILGQNDVVYVCPVCKSRNYIPVDWNIKLVRFIRRNYL